MIEIYPSPLSLTGTTYNSAALKANLESKWPGTIVEVFNPAAFYSLDTTGSYTNIQSSAFEVDVWDPNTSQYSSAFVYKCGLTKAAPIGQYQEYSVWGEGVTGAPKGSFTPLLTSAHGQFNYLTFGTSEETKIRVKYKKGPISSIDIGPHSKGLNSKWSRVIDTSTVEISGINPNHKLFIQVSTTFGLDASTPLMVFSDPPSPTPPAGSFVLYFAPGILQFKKFNNDYSAGGFSPFFLPPFSPQINQRLDLSNIGFNSLIPSGSTIYVDGGCYVDGTFGCKYLSGITFMGRGVVDAYRGDDWWDKWSYLVPGMNDETKLPYSPFMGYSSFSEGSDVLGKSPNNKLEGLTVVNQIIYTNTVNFVDVSNVKVINQLANGDFLRVGEYFSFNNRLNRLVKITNCFGFVGDDCFFPAEADCDTIVSSCYIIPIFATAFRTYFGRYNGGAYNNTEYGFSAIDIDIRSYAGVGYYSKDRPIYSQFRPSIFGLWMTSVKKTSIGYDPLLKYYVGDCLFSGIRVEGYCDVPLFDIGIRSYPASIIDANSVIEAAVDYPEVYGNISGIQFIDISASSHPYSKYKWVYSNAVFASEPEFRPYDITFKNVSIDGITITDQNKDQFFSWENYSVPEDVGRDLTNPSDGSAIADVYLLVGDGIAYGLSGFAKDLSTISQYSSVISSGVAIPGCYIFSSNGTFVPLIPGITTLEPSIGRGDMGPEPFLAYQLRQKSGNRDVYFIKCASSYTIAVSSFSGYYDGPGQGNWSISAANSMYSRFKASATAAIGAIRSLNKFPDLKAGFIFLGGSVPGEAVNNLAAASALINTDISGLIGGIRSTFASATPPGLNVDTTYTELFWIGPQYGNSFVTESAEWVNNNNFKYYLKQKLIELDSSSYRLHYYNPDDSLFNSDFRHFDTSAYAIVADDLIELLDQETSSVTDPDLNPEVNYLFLFDNFEFPEDFIEKGSNPEIYAPTGAGIESIRSTRYRVDVYDTTGYTEAFTFGRTRTALAAFGKTPENLTERNKLWELGSTPELSFLTFGASGETTVKVSKKNTQITSARIRPGSKNYKHTIINGDLYIQMNPKDKAWVTVNNETSSPLFVFCDYYKDPIPNDPKLYFGPGIHYVSALLPATGTHTGKVFETTAGTFTTIRGLGFSSFDQYGYVEGQPFTVYLDGGAYVIGSFDLRKKHNITFKGPGIISVQNLPKETMMTLKDMVENPYPASRDIGAIPIHHALGYDEYTSQYNFGGVIGNIEYPDLNKIASGVLIKDITIIDTPFYNIHGVNTVSGVKLLSPWAYNSDGITLMPDSSTKKGLIADCFILVADDVFQVLSNDAGNKFYDDIISAPGVRPLLDTVGVRPAYGWTIGGSTTISGTQAYTVNNNVFGLYFAYYSPNNPPTGFQFGDSYPNLIYDCDFNSYSVSTFSPFTESIFRITTDLSSTPADPSISIYGGSYKNWGIRNLTVSNIRIEDPIDCPLFQIGNIPDPFNDPNEPTIGDRGNEFGYVSGIILKNIEVSGESYNTQIYSNRIWGRDVSSRPSNITLENIKINGTYLTQYNKDSFISWASGTNPTFTNPDVYNSNIVFLFTLPTENGFTTSKGVLVDYHWDRGQLHPFVATLHYIQEQEKLMQASAYYDDHLDEYSINNWWKNNLQSYANSSTEFSGAFPNSFDNYTTYRFGRDFQKLYYDYTHNFQRHRAIPTTTLLDGPTIFGHTFGSIFYNSKLDQKGTFTQAYPQYITSSLSNIQELFAGTPLFSSSGAASGTYVASTVADVLVHYEDGTRIPEFRNSGILDHIEFVHPSGASVFNTFAILNLDRTNRSGYRYNPLIHENVLIKQKSRNSNSRFAFDIRKYSTNSNLGYDVSTNFLSPNHEYKLNLKSLISNFNGEIFGGDSISVWIHTKPEQGKIWTFTKEGNWIQHDLTSVTQSNLVRTYSHTFSMPETIRDLTGSSISCSRFRLIDNPNRENDVIASLAESDFNKFELIFNTHNKDLEVPQSYFDKISTQVHRLNQNYVIEIFSNCTDNQKFTLFYDINLTDLTLNKWSKPFVTGKTNGTPVGEIYCKEYRVDLNRNHLLHILKYFNEIAGAYSSFGYASRNQAYTSGVYESRGGSRINYVESPEWNPVTKSSNGGLIKDITITN